MRRAALTSPPMGRSGFGAAGWRPDPAIRALRPSADTRELISGAESMPSAASGTLARDEVCFACGLERRKWEMAAGFLLAALRASWLSAGSSAGADEGPEASTVASGTGEDTNGAVRVFAGGSTLV